MSNAEPVCKTKIDGMKVIAGVMTLAGIAYGVLIVGICALIGVGVAELIVQFIMGE